MQPIEWLDPFLDNGKKRETCIVRLLTPVSIAGHPGLKVGSLVELERPTAATLAGNGSVEMVDEKGKSMIPPPLPATKRVRILRPVVIAGYPGAKVGDIVTLPRGDGEYLIHEGSAEEVPATGWRKLAEKIGL